MKWQVGQIAILKKKKKNGFPKSIEIGDSLEIIHVHGDGVLVIKGNKRISDSFKLHETYLEDIVEYRNRIIEEILIDE